MDQEGTKQERRYQFFHVRSFFPDGKVRDEIGDFENYLAVEDVTETDVADLS
jgi:hypothetical protein